MKVSFKKIISLLVLSLLLVWISFYVKSHLGEFKDINQISPSNLFFLIGFTFLYFLVQGLILRTILEPFGVHLKFREWFGITMITLLGNFLIPFGGFSFRATYLKKVYSFDYTYFVSTLGAILLFEFLIFTSGGLLGLLVSFLQFQRFNPILTALLLMIFIICGFFLLFSPPLPNFKSKVYLRLRGVIESWYNLKKNQKFLKTLFALTFWEWIFSSAMFYFAFSAFDFKITFVDAFLPATLSTYSLLIRLLPASFGFYEGAIVAASNFLGFNISQGLLVTAATRFASVLWIFTLGPIFSYILIRGQSKTNRSFSK